MENVFRLLLLCVLLLAATRSLAQAGEPRKSESLVYGINIVWGVNGSDQDWTRDNMHLKLARYAREIGATNTRVGVTWCVVEEEQGRYDWTETDKRVDFLHRQGFELVACVANTPTWATGLEEEALEMVRRKYPGFMTVLPCADQHLEALGRWCEEAARRYRGKIKYYEIGNEDDGCPAPIIVRDYTGKPIDVRIGGDPAVYTKRLKVCYNAIKKADPDARVGVSGLQGEGHTMFLQQIYANGGGGCFDAVGLHPYVDHIEQGIFWQWLDQTKDLLEFMGDSHKRFWLTEWGYSVNDSDPDSLAKHAESVEQVLLRMEKLDYIEQASLHTLNDWRTEEGNPGSVQRMGLMTFDLKPRPAFHAYRRAAHGEGEIRDALTMGDPPKLREPGGGEPVPCDFARNTPRIDGYLEDWADAQPFALTDKDGGEGATARIKWDRRAFYLAVHVTDDYHYQPYGSDSMWRGDSIQIAFDPERETRKWPDYGYDDTEYGFCLTPAGVQGFRFHGGVRYPAGVVVPLRKEPVVAKSRFGAAARRVGDGHLYEVAIPWSEITPARVEPGKLIGFSIAVNNYDSSHSRTVYEFGGGITSGKDPSLFRPIVLRD